VLMTASDIADSHIFRELASSLKIDSMMQKPILSKTLKRIIQKQRLLYTSSNISVANAAENILGH
jgi:hypothetical protein